MLAQTVELLHELILTTIRISPFVKVSHLPPPLRIRRPGEKPQSVSMGEFARLMKRGG